jgi:hypothetical protein
MNAPQTGQFFVINFTPSQTCADTTKFPKKEKREEREETRN